MTAPFAPAVRVGDRERERTADQLGSALAQGYLEMAEFESRLQAAFAAHTTAELRALVADLPLAQLRRDDPRRRKARRAAARRGVHLHLAGYLGMGAGVGTFTELILERGADRVLAIEPHPAGAAA